MSGQALDMEGKIFHSASKWRRHLDTKEGDKPDEQGETRDPVSVVLNIRQEIRDAVERFEKRMLALHIRTPAQEVPSDTEISRL